MSEETTNTTGSIPQTVAVKLRELGVVDEEIIGKIQTELGVESTDQLSILTEADLIGVGMKKVPARTLVTKLVALKAPPVVDTTVGAATAFGGSFEALLPSVLTDESWLQALRTGGVLKVDQSTVISAPRVALAHRSGLFGIPGDLVGLMEEFADQNEEAVDPEYFKLRKQLTRRSYAEIFEAVDGLDGTYVTEARKKQLLSRIDEHMWPAMIGFHLQLKQWQEAWMQGAANPAMMMMAFMGASGGGGGVMPAGMMQPPDTGTLRDTADAVADAINKVFAGTGVQIAAAMAYEAVQIKTTLENPRLPALIGAANRDQMLKKLGVAVSATYPRMELNLTRYVLGVLHLKDQPAGNEELQYLGAMFMLGSQIPWDQLGGGTGRGRVSGIRDALRDGGKL